jgi:hypothetical protein
MQGAWAKIGSEAAFRRNTAARVSTIEAAHNPEVAGSNPAPATGKGPGDGAFLMEQLTGFENTSNDRPTVTVRMARADLA